MPGMCGYRAGQAKPLQVPLHELMGRALSEPPAGSMPGAHLFSRPWLGCRPEGLMLFTAYRQSSSDSHAG